MYNYYRIEIGSVSMDYNNVENKNYFGVRHYNVKIVKEKIKPLKFISRLRRVAVHALFVTGRRITVLAQSAAGLAHAVAGEGGTLKQQAGGVLVHAGVCTAHDAGQSHRLLCVADDQIVGVQGELLLIEVH